MSIIIVTDSRESELEETLALNSEYIEQLEALYDEWHCHMPTALANLLKKEFRLKKEQNDDMWDELETVTELLEWERALSPGMIKTRLISCCECDGEYKRDVEIGNELQFLRNERCLLCDGNAFELGIEDMNTGKIFNTITNEFEDQ